MALTSVGAFYATQSKLLQRVYVPSADDSEINQQPIQSGETLLLVPLATYQQTGVQGIQASLGTPNVTGSGFANASGRCAVVDNTNTVINHITADPAVYADPSGNLVIPHDHTIIGDIWTGTAFTRPFAQVSTATGLYLQVTTQNIDATTGGLLQSLVPGSSSVTIGALAPFATKLGIGVVSTGVPV